MQTSCEKSSPLKESETRRRLDWYRITVIENPWIPVAPFPRQQVFLSEYGEECLFGGAAGGGKSIGILAAALQGALVPGYSALLLRRTFQDLNQPRALIPLSHEWLQGTKAKWDSRSFRWHLPGDVTLSFGYVDAATDVYRYQGAEYQFVGFDELTQFTEDQYLYLFSRLRKTQGMPIPLRMRATSNPGGVGHEWVRDRFLAGDRPFVPAKLEHNPALDRASYESQLARLDPVTRAQLRHGDWTVRPEGNLFKREWFDGQILGGPPPCVRKVRYWDLASTEPAPGKDPDYTAGILMGADGAGGYVVLDCQEFRATPHNRNRVIAATADADGRDVEVWVEQEPGSAGLNTIDQMARDVLPGYGVYPMRHTGDKLTRAKPFSAACERGLVKLVRGTWLGAFLDRLCGFGLPGVHDDVPDAASAAHEALAVRGGAWDEAAARRAFDGPARPIGEAGEVSRHLPRLLREAGEWGGGD
jgi:predicted phage terminase large subunit-like protein